MSWPLRILLLVLPASCLVVIPMRNYTFEFNGENFTAEYVFNTTFGKFGSGCDDGYVPAVIPGNVSAEEFFAEIAEEVLLLACYTAGKRRTTTSEPRENATRNGSRFVWNFSGQEEDIPDELWGPNEPESKEGYDYVSLVYGGLYNIPNMPLPHCCMKVIKPMCEDHCVHGKCVEKDICSCDTGFQGRFCDLQTSGIVHLVKLAVITGLVLVGLAVFACILLVRNRITATYADHIKNLNSVI